MPISVGPYAPSRNRPMTRGEESNGLASSRSIIGNQHAHESAKVRRVYMINRLFMGEHPLFLVIATQSGGWSRPTPCTRLLTRQPAEKVAGSPNMSAATQPASLKPQDRKDRGHASIVATNFAGVAAG